MKHVNEFLRFLNALGILCAGLALWNVGTQLYYSPLTASDIENTYYCGLSVRTFPRGSYWIVQVREPRGESMAWGNRAQVMTKDAALDLCRGVQ